MTPLAFYKQMIEAGVPHDIAMPLAEKFERDELAEQLAKLTERRAKATEKKRRQRAASPGTDGDKPGQTGTDGDREGQPGTKDAPAPTCARVRDNNPRLVISGSAVAVVERASDPVDDWPEGKPQRLAEILVSEVGSPWLDPAKSQSLHLTVGRLAAWQRDGASWSHDVVPVVRAVCAKRRSRVNSWRFFDDAIAQSIADNRAALTIPEARVVPLRPGGPRTIDEKASAAWDYAIAKIAQDEQSQN